MTVRDLPLPSTSPRPASPDFTARPFRTSTLQPAYNASTNYPDTQSAALRGASLAFVKPPVKPKPLINTYTGPDGARLAASKADIQKGGSQPTSSSSSRNGSPPGREGNTRGGLDPGNGSLQAARQSVSRERARDVSQTQRAGTELLRGADSRGGLARSASTSASSLAATRAAARSGLVSKNLTGNSGATTPERRINRFSAQWLPKSSTMQAADERTDSTSMEPTSSLIGRFERGSNDVPAGPSMRSTAQAPAIQSPRPLRPVSSTALPLSAALVASQKPSPPKPVDLPRSSSARLQLKPEKSPLPSNLSGKSERSQSVGPPDDVDQSSTTAPPAPPPARKTRKKAAVSNPSQPSAGSNDTSDSPIPPPARSSASKPAPPNPRSVPLQPQPRDPSSSQSSLDTTTPPFHSHAHPHPASMALALHPPEPDPLHTNYTNEQLLTLYGRHPSTSVSPNPNPLPPPPPARRLNPHLTGDSLASAIVASSLASSRAPSPAKHSSPDPLLPPLPPPRRRIHTPSLFHHHTHRSPETDPLSRTPSPPKPPAGTSLRTTLRKQPAHVPDEEDDERDRRGRKKHLIKKAPNKHHEGDRKRWRDAVTERERKRYEGVWAANKGVFTSKADRCGDVAGVAAGVPSALGTESAAAAGAGTADADLDAAADAEESEIVSNLLVRDLWSRSRLGADALEEVWDLVDRRGDGCLSREEFVVGLWLIDQRLKGRKLPVRVSASVWESVRRMGGVKVKVRVKAKNKARR